MKKLIKSNLENVKINIFVSNKIGEYFQCSLIIWNQIKYGKSKSKHNYGQITSWEYFLFGKQMQDFRSDAILFWLFFCPSDMFCFIDSELHWLFALLRTKGNYKSDPMKKKLHSYGNNKSEEMVGLILRSFFFHFYQSNASSWKTLYMESASEKYKVEIYLEPVSSVPVAALLEHLVGLGQVGRDDAVVHEEKADSETLFCVP